MSDESRLRILREIFAAFAKSGDVTPLMNAVTDDVVMRLTIREGTPLSGVFKGKDGVAKYFENHEKTVEILAFEVTSYLTGGDQVAVAGRETFKVVPSGEVVAGSDWVTLCTFRGDKISEIVVVDNTAAISNAYR